MPQYHMAINRVQVSDVNLAIIKIHTDQVQDY